MRCLRLLSQSPAESLRTLSRVRWFAMAALTLLANSNSAKAHHEDSVYVSGRGRDSRLAQRVCVEIAGVRDRLARNSAPSPADVAQLEEDLNLLESSGPGAARELGCEPLTRAERTPLAKVARLHEQDCHLTRQLAFSSDWPQVLLLKEARDQIRADLLPFTRASVLARRETLICIPDNVLLLSRARENIALAEAARMITEALKQPGLSPERAAIRAGDSEEASNQLNVAGNIARSMTRPSGDSPAFRVESIGTGPMTPAAQVKFDRDALNPEAKEIPALTESGGTIGTTLRP